MQNYTHSYKYLPLLEINITKVKLAFLITVPLRQLFIGPRHQLTEINFHVAMALFLKKTATMTTTKSVRPRG